MGKLTKLTAEQVAAMVEVRDEWLAHGLSTQPADRDAAVAGARLAYAERGLPAPRLVVWLDSPMAGCIGATMLGQVWDQVRGQVGGQVRDQVRGQVRDQVWDQVRDQVGGQVGRSLWGQHDAGWLAWTDYWARARHTSISLPATEGLRTVGRNAGWWWTWADCVLLTDRPEHLSRDNLTRLHDETGMALRYRDGWGMWCWHGLRVPEWVVRREKRPADILAEPNQEIRRAGIEAYGWDALLSELHITPVSTAPDPGNPGHELALVDVPATITGEPLSLVLCVNGSVERDGTRRRYALDVTGSGKRDALAAVAWTYGLDAAEYALLEARS